MANIFVSDVDSMIDISLPIMDRSHATLVPRIQEQTAEGTHHVQIMKMLYKAASIAFPPAGEQVATAKCQCTGSRAMWKLHVIINK